MARASKHDLEELASGKASARDRAEAGLRNAKRRPNPKKRGRRRRRSG